MDWTLEMKDRLVSHVREGRLSFNQIADSMSKEFGVPFTRNSCIGKSRRVSGRVPKVYTKPRSLVVRTPKPTKPKSVQSELCPLPLHSLGKHNCHWPLGDQIPFLYCGKVTREGSSYCWEHCKMSYVGSKTP